RFLIPGVHAKTSPCIWHFKPLNSTFNDCSTSWVPRVLQQTNVYCCYILRKQLLYQSYSFECLLWKCVDGIRNKSEIAVTYFVCKFLDCNVKTAEKEQTI